MGEAWQTIIKVGGEGGSLSLYGMKQDNGKWLYSTTTQEIHDLEEEEPPLNSSPQDNSERKAIKLKPTVRLVEKEIVDNWEDAIELLSDYPWTRFVPLEVHPDFKMKVWGKINKTDLPFNRSLRWERLCTN